MIDETVSSAEPRWLLWAREMQALAQTGLAFTRDQYDRERYQQLRALAAAQWPWLVAAPFSASSVLQQWNVA